jgi:hypothetical protein
VLRAAGDVHRARALHALKHHLQREAHLSKGLVERDGLALQDLRAAAAAAAGEGVVGRCAAR